MIRATWTDFEATFKNMRDMNKFIGEFRKLCNKYSKNGVFEWTFDYEADDEEK